MQTEPISNITNEQKGLRIHLDADMQFRYIVSVKCNRIYKILVKETDTEIFTDFSGGWVTPMNKLKANSIL